MRNLDQNPFMIFLPHTQLFHIDIIPQEYAETIEYLQSNKFLSYYNELQKRLLAFKSMSYTIIANTFHKQVKDGVLRRHVTNSEIPLKLKKCHHNMIGGHFARYVTARKILQSKYWWPAIFSYCTTYTRQCDYVRGVAQLSMRSVRNTMGTKGTPE